MTSPALLETATDAVLLIPTLPSVKRPAAKKKSPLRRFIRPLVMMTAFLAAAVLIWIYLVPYFLQGRAIDRPLTAFATRGDLKITITERGELDSIEAVQMTCELQGGGKLVSIIEEGKHVRKGDEVAKLDTDTLLKSLNDQDVKWQTAEGKVKSCKSDLFQAQNKAQSEIAKADLALTLAKIDLESYTDPQGEYKKELDKLKGTLELKRKDLKDAQDDIAFTKSLVKDGYAQPEQLRAKELSVQQRKFEVTSAEAEVTVLEKFTRKRKETELKAKAEEAERELERTKLTQQSAIDKSESELKAAESTAAIEKRQLEYVKAQIERCTIKAPSDGILVYSNSRPWDESARIRPGAQLYYRQEIFQLPDLSRMKVKMKIHESVIKKVRAGMSATFQVEALTNLILNGEVQKIATIAQSDGWRGAGVKQYETELSIKDLPTDAGLKPGMTAEVKILVGVIPDAISVPMTAVTEYEGEKVVYVMHKNTITRTAVTVGESNDQYVQIVNGLQPGDEVTLDARTRAAADMKASAKKEKSEKSDKAKEPEAAKVAIKK